jgi:arylsulfatase A-like enzyme
MSREEGAALRRVHHRHNRLPGPQRQYVFSTYTLPALLKAAGYRTGIIGKLHVNPKSAFRFDLNRNKDLGPNNG